MSSKYRLLKLESLGAMAALAFVFAITHPATSRADVTIFNSSVLTGGSSQEGTGDNSKGALDNFQLDYMGPGRGLENTDNEQFSSPPSHFDVEVPMPIKGRAGRLHVRVECIDTDALPDGTSFEFDVEKNGVDTALACTALGTGSTLATCQDDVHTVPFLRDDKLSVKVSPQPIDGPEDEECRVAGWTVSYTSADTFAP